MLWHKLHCWMYGHDWLATVWGDCVTVECVHCHTRLLAQFDGEQPYVNSWYVKSLVGVAPLLRGNHPLEPTRR